MTLYCKISTHEGDRAVKFHILRATRYRIDSQSCINLYIDENENVQVSQFAF